MGPPIDIFQTECDTRTLCCFLTVQIHNHLMPGTKRRFYLHFDTDISGIVPYSFIICRSRYRDAFIGEGCFLGGSWSNHGRRHRIEGFNGRGLLELNLFRSFRGYIGKYHIAILVHGPVDILCTGGSTKREHNHDQ